MLPEYTETSPLLDFTSNTLIGSAVSHAKHFLWSTNTVMLEKFAVDFHDLTNNPMVSVELLKRQLAELIEWLLFATYNPAVLMPENGAIEVSHYELVSIAFSYVDTNQCFTNHPQHRYLVQEIIETSVAKLDDTPLYVKIH